LSIYPLPGVLLVRAQQGKQPAKKLKKGSGKKLPLTTLF